MKNILLSDMVLISLFITRISRASGNSGDGNSGDSNSAILGTAILAILGTPYLIHSSLSNSGDNSGGHHT